MIHVIATVTARSGQRSALLEQLNQNLAAVQAEEGCIEYFPVLDVADVLGAVQQSSDDVITIIERWQTLEHLKAHSVAPHMLSYREKVKDLVESTSVRVMQEP